MKRNLVTVRIPALVTLIPQHMAYAGDDGLSLFPQVKLFYHLRSIPTIRVRSMPERDSCSKPRRAVIIGGKSCKI